MKLENVAADIGELGQKVLVMQGGGALGAYQVGVYRALHQAGIDFDWVIGTSIGAINASLIAGNAWDDRIAALESFWERVTRDTALARFFPNFERAILNAQTFTTGLPGFFRPNPMAFMNPFYPLGPEEAGYYSTEPLRKTLSDLVDPTNIAKHGTDLSVGAASVSDGELTYFHSRPPNPRANEPTTLTVDHVMASGALPPAFPPVRIEGKLYWDGGILSNTPIEAVLDANPRMDNIIFSVQLWNQDGSEPQSMWDVFNREKDIQYASRAETQVARQKELHKLRHIIKELANTIPDDLKTDAVDEMASWGCLTRNHIVRFLAPTLENEDHLKDIDFSPDGVAARAAAGYEHTCRALEAAPWNDPFDPIEGVIFHDTCGGERITSSLSN
ncbi:MAG: patatin-like phospholipase family protein [Pseudomonadota bacterium]